MIVRCCFRMNDTQAGGSVRRVRSCHLLDRFRFLARRAAGRQQQGWKYYRVQYLSIHSRNAEGFAVWRQLLFRGRQNVHVHVLFRLGDRIEVIFSVDNTRYGAPSNGQMTPGTTGTGTYGASPVLSLIMVHKSCCNFLCYTCLLKRNKKNQRDGIPRR